MQTVSPPLAPSSESGYRLVPLALLLGLLASGCRGTVDERAASGDRHSGASRGSVVYLDDRGRPIVPADRAAADGAATRAALSRQAEPEPTPSPLRVEAAPGGGDMIITRGRLRAPMVAHLSEPHRLRTECGSGALGEDAGAGR